MKPVKSAKAETNQESPIIESNTLTAEDVALLKQSFPKERLGVKVQSFNRERTRAMLVLYLQHTEVQDRLEEVDPSWSFQVLDEQRHGDSTFARARLTVKGVSRENVGEGGDPKAAYSDALKRCAMLFGIGRFLYDSPNVWVEYDDNRDRFKKWTVEDYEGAARKTSFAPAGRPTPSAAAQGSRVVRPLQPRDRGGEDRSIA